jgi:hypothetical protein
MARVNPFSGEMTFIGKRVHRDWSARSAPDTGIKRRYDPSTFSHRGHIRAGSVANRALRQMFNNPNEQAAEPCQLFKGRHFVAEKRSSRAGLPH